MPTPPANSSISGSAEKPPATICEDERSEAWLAGPLIRRASKVLAAFYGCCVIIGWVGIIRTGALPTGTDFVLWWSASQLVVQGKPAAVYDFATLRQVEKSVAGPGTAYVAPFGYPPIYLLIIAPLARLPYLPSLLLWSAISIGLYVTVVLVLAPRFMIQALAFPALFLTLLSGQNSCLTLACLGMGVAWAEEHPILAGIPFALTGYKPQFALLIPLFLLSRRNLKAAASTAAALSLLIAASIWLFGVESWTAFLLALDSERKSVLEGAGWPGLQSTFNSSRVVGLNLNVSYYLHTVVAAITSVLAVLAWRRSPNAELRGAVLLIAALIVTPYAMHYDLLLLVLPLAWLAFQDGISRWENCLLVIAWMYPLFALNVIRNGVPIAPVLLCALFLMAVRRCFLSLPAPSSIALSSAI